MDDTQRTARLERAVRIAREAWRQAHGGAVNPMTQTAAIPAVGALAAALLARLDGDDDAALEQATLDAIRVAQAAWARTAEDVASNPIARTAEKAVIGILSAVLLNDYLQRAP
jgi:hypothetical protein